MPEVRVMSRLSSGPELTDRELTEQPDEAPKVIWMWVAQYGHVEVVESHPAKVR